ncbi:MAG TPA: histidine phosphatase family protein [Candidatus Udaeobacter sp.]|jgi:probable phosphoglycerate mutase|nr:histidine phosphatase family protein [Candidatus Udaeobacter sp.]
MTNVLLIRHATHDAVGKTILGRTPGVHLNDSGRRQAAQLAETLSVLPIDAVYCGPLERTRESAEPLARRLGLPLHVADEFDELEMGDWTNRTLAELDLLPEWRKWNAQRSEIIPPNGESMHQVQVRVLAKIAALGNRFSCTAVFTHGDVIRAAISYFLGMHLELLFRFQIDLGSVSIVQMHAGEAVVRILNWIPIKTAIG